MRIELIPLILGALVALLGVGIIVDAWTPDGEPVVRERRRRPRVERHRGGEALIGLGVLALAGAFVGRDTWRFSTLVVIIGAAFLILGAILNAAYLRELFTNRGPLRRRPTPPPEELIPGGRLARRNAPVSSTDGDVASGAADYTSASTPASAPAPSAPPAAPPPPTPSRPERRAHPRGGG